MTALLGPIAASEIVRAANVRQVRSLAKCVMDTIGSASERRNRKHEKPVNMTLEPEQLTAGQIA